MKLRLNPSAEDKMDAAIQIRVRAEEKKWIKKVCFDNDITISQLFKIMFNERFGD